MINIVELKFYVAAIFFICGIICIAKAGMAAHQYSSDMHMNKAKKLDLHFKIIYDTIAAIAWTLVGFFILLVR